MSRTPPRVSLVCLDPVRDDLGDFKPFNYSIRKVQAAMAADEACDADVTVVEYNSKNVEEFTARIEALDPDIVGASAYVWSFPTFYEVARALKRSRPDRLIVFGGPSARPDLFRLAPYRQGPEFIDALVLGEGEEVFRKIVALTDRTRAGLATVNGLAVSTGQGWTNTAPATLPTLDTLASPFQLGLVSGVKTAHLETFRGCPLSCTFCQWGDLSKANRVFSFEYLVRELSSYVELGVRSAMIVDAALNLNPRAFRNLRAAEKEVGFFKKAFLHAEVYPQFINKDHLDFLSELEGGINLGLGLQSYNQKVLGNVDRAFDEKKFDTVVRQLLEITPRTEIEIIMGLPGDSPDSFRRTLEKALKLGTAVRVYHCLVLPGALMSRSPESFNMDYDFVDLSMKSCLGWENGAIQSMSRELSDLVNSSSAAFHHNDGYGWHFPSEDEKSKGPDAWHYMNTLGAESARHGKTRIVELGEATRSADQASGARDVTVAPRSMRNSHATFFEQVAQAVVLASSGTWELDDMELNNARVTMRVSLGMGTGDDTLIVDVRNADGTPSYCDVDGVAFSYRRTTTPVTDNTLRSLEAVISEVGPLVRSAQVIPDAQPAVG